jgi:hypothetical protein
VKAKLYFFHQPGCEGCTIATPHVKAFEKAHPEVTVVWWDLTDRAWTLSIAQPDGTPAYLLIDAQGPRTLTGWVLTKEILERWLRRQPLTP